MIWYVGVTCCSERQENYLPQTLDSIKAAGWPVVNCQSFDGGVKGSWGNFRHVVQEALRHNPTPDAVLVMQDDAVLSRNVRQLVEDQRVLEEDKLGVLSLYTCGGMAKKLSGSGWHDLGINDMPRRCAGACAIVLPRASAEKLIADPPHPECLTMTDLWLGQFCRRNMLKWRQHVPSLCRHIGRVRAIKDQPITGNRDWWTEWRHEGEFVEDASKAVDSLLQQHQIPVLC